MAQRHFENRDGIVQWHAGPEVLARLPRLFHTKVTALMAFHANVIR